MSDQRVTGPVQRLRVEGRPTTARVLRQLLEAVGLRSRLQSTEREAVRDLRLESPHRDATKPDSRCAAPKVPRTSECAQTLMLELRKRLCVLTSELVQGEEGERRRSALFLHDHLAQTLTRLQDRLSLLARADDCAGKISELEHVADLLKDATALARRLTFDVSPPVLCARELVAALQWLGEEISDEHELEFNLTLQGEPAPLAQVDAALLYGAGRELLRAVVLHAGATEIHAAMRWRANVVEIEVRNDGVGLKPSLSTAPDENERDGLFGVRERIEAMGGSMEIGSGAGEGTRVSLTVPLQHPEDGAER